MDLAAIEIRRLHRKVAQAERRLAMVNLPGKVHPGSQDYQARTLRLELGESADGRPILSPRVRWQQPGAGRFKVHTPPDDHEQMALQSPSGTVGTGSLALSATYDQDHGAPSSSAEEAVLEFGEKSRLTMRADEMIFELGSTKIRMSEGRLRLDSPRIDLNEGGG